MLGVLLLGSSVLFAASHKAPKRSPKSSAAHAKHTTRSSRHAWRWRGQKTIDPDRARQIQQALVREGYLQGPATGQWDDTSKAAMARYQADHGWQTRTVPDARALIKLGLGPSQTDLIHPEGAAPAPGAAAEKPAGDRQD